MNSRQLKNWIGDVKCCCWPIVSEREVYLALMPALRLRSGAQVTAFGQQSKVTGAVIRHKHPALAMFPTDDVLDWQWQPLCSDAEDYDEVPTNSWRNLPQITNPNARGFVLDNFPASYRPIVQPVADYQRPVKLAAIFEVKTDHGGKLMVCGYDIADSLDSRPTARQLRKSLLAYMTSESFAPDYTVDNDWILTTFAKTDRPLAMPDGYKNAYIYIVAGGRHPSGFGNVPRKQSGTP